MVWDFGLRGRELYSKSRVHLSYGARTRNHGAPSHNPSHSRFAVYRCGWRCGFRSNFDEQRLLGERPGLCRCFRFRRDHLNPRTDSLSGFVSTPQKVGS